MDLSYTKKNERLNIRVAALITKDNQFLVINDFHAKYDYLIGGRVQLFEDSETAILREIKEELNEIPQMMNLCFTYESFFKERTLDLMYHELGFVYLIQLSPQSELLHKKETIIKGNCFKWVNIDELVEPQFIMKYIQQNGIPKSVVHLVSNEITNK